MLDDALALALMFFQVVGIFAVAWGLVSVWRYLSAKPDPDWTSEGNRPRW